MRRLSREARRLLYLTLALGVSGWVMQQPDPTNLTWLQLARLMSHPFNFFSLVAMVSSTLIAAFKIKPTNRGVTDEQSK